MSESGILTRDEARKAFWELRLTYDKALTTERIAKLCDFLDEAFKKEKQAILADPRNELGIYYWKKTLRKKAIIAASRIPSRGIQCYVEASGGYFSSRECVSFNPCLDKETGKKWIGFCGDADDHNSSVVTGAFAKWVEWLKKQPDTVSQG